METGHFSVADLSGDKRDRHEEVSSEEISCARARHDSRLYASCRTTGVCQFSNKRPDHRVRRQRICERFDSSRTTRALRDLFVAQLRHTRRVVA